DTGRSAYPPCRDVAPLSQARIRRALTRYRWTLIVAALATAIPAVVVPASPASALAPTQYRLSGFSLGTGQDTNMPDTLTNFVYLPSGQILAINKNGQVRRGTFGGSLWAPVSFTTQDPINSDVDRGMVGIAIAPDYASTGTVYLLYDYNKNNC